MANEGIARLSPRRQNAAREGDGRKQGVVTTPRLSDEAIAVRREAGLDESSAIPSNDRQDIYLTSPTLLNRIKEGDDASWSEFHERYRRFIWCIARSYQVREADRDAVVNGVLVELHAAKDRFQYDPDKGRYRDYLRKVVKHHILRLRRSEHPTEDLEGGGFEEPGEADFDEIWDKEWRDYVLEQARQLLRERLDPVTYQVASRSAFANEPPEKLAEEFHIKTEHVYLIKHRALKLLRAYRAQLGDDAARSEDEASARIADCQTEP
ncbi:MAG: sigma-70 family RNA polymerase sigma factor [Victivallales bacterium]|nr:sigma-70 family RNA polymerase sigma factor [Victivallales bacterium]